MGFNLPVLNRWRRYGGGAGGAFNPATLFSLGEPGLWLDPSDVANLDWRRNLLTYTEQFDNAAWTKIRATVAANAATDPLGQVTADRVIPSVDNNTHRIDTAVALTDGATYTYSVYAKADGYDGLALEIGNTAIGTNYARFDLISGTATSVGTAVASIESVGGGWFRCSCRMAAGVADQIAQAVWNGGSGSFAGNGTSGIFIWGAQLELGSVATDYQRISDVNTEVLERFPKTTMYQDRAGVTAVTTPGQTVGLRLDKSKGLVQGPEQITNGTFDSGPTGWYAAGSGIALSGAFVVGGALRVGTSTEQNPATTISTLPIGGVVVVTFRARLVSGSVAALVRFSNAFGANIVTAANFGTLTPTWSDYRLVFTNTSVTRGVFSFREDSGIGGVYEVDNISVKELAGNHAQAIDDAARGIYGIEPLGGRRNLLTFTEQFDNAAWGKTNTTVAANAGVAPDGTTTADRVVPAAGSSVKRVTQGITLTGVSTFTATFTAKADGYNRVALLDPQHTASGSAAVDLRDGSQANLLNTAGTTQVTPLGNGWYRIVWVFSGYPPAAVNYNIGLAPLPDTGVTNSFSDAWTANGTSGVLVWGAQLETGSTATAYQRVTDQYNVTQAGIPSVHYVQYDDDGYVTPTITPLLGPGSGPELVVSSNGAVRRGSIAPDVNYAPGTNVVAGRTYSVTYTISNNSTSTSSASWRVDLVGGQITIPTVAAGFNGTVTGNYLASASGNLSLNADSPIVNFTISNVSVREVVADKAQVFAGVRKLSDAATGMIVESSTDAGSNNGAFRLLVPGSAGYEYRQRGTINAAGAGANSGYASPITNVLTGLGDISGDLSVIRINGAQVANSRADQGTGTFLAYPIYIGRRAGTSLPFNGRDYGLIVRFGTTLSDSTIASTEAWLGGKTAFSAPVITGVPTIGVT